MAGDRRILRRLSGQRSAHRMGKKPSMAFFHLADHRKAEVFHRENGQPPTQRASETVPPLSAPTGTGAA
jgi:hypothetical protein